MDDSTLAVVPLLNRHANRYAVLGEESSLVFFPRPEVSPSACLPLPSVRSCGSSGQDADWTDVERVVGARV